MPLACYMCLKDFPHCSTYFKHLGKDHAKHFEHAVVFCKQDGCPRSFESFRNAKAHILKNHSNLLIEAENELLSEKSVLNM